MTIKHWLPLLVLVVVTFDVIRADKKHCWEVEFRNIYTNEAYVIPDCKKITQHLHREFNSISEAQIFLNGAPSDELPLFSEGLHERKKRLVFYTDPDALLQNFVVNVNGKQVYP